MNKDSTVFQNIDYKNKIKSKPMPSSIPGIDTDALIYDNIEAAASDKSLDITKLNSFTNISRSRDQVYNLIDSMGEDSIISEALDIYTADACETNEAGQVVWAESADSSILRVVEMILESLNVNKNSYDWMYSLIKYGDLYLRLYRESEVDDAKKKNSAPLNEDVIVKAYSKNDKYAKYAEIVKNPAEVFDLTRFGKTYGFLRTHIISQQSNADDVLSQLTNWRYQYQFDRNDVDIYPATEFVHASLDDNSDRTEEEVTIGNTGEDEEAVTFSVKRGKSILYDSFKVWRELSLLENAVLLNRLTKSSIVRTVSVEVGDMEKSAVSSLLSRIKQMIEQKSAIRVGQSINEYTNPGPMENIIYTTTHDGKGAITTSQIGGDVDVGDLSDLKTWKKKLFSSLGIPGQYLGDTEDSTGFNGGSSLSLISSRYAKKVKRIQNVFAQMITDAVNLILLDMGLPGYINNFTIKMQAPTTQEEKDRKENMSSSINNVQNIMGLLDGIENPQIRLKIVHSLLSNVVNNSAVSELIQEAIDEFDVQQDEEDFTDTDSEDISFDQDFGQEELPSFDNMNAPDEISSNEIPPEEPMESFESGEGGELLVEKDLPSFAELNLSYDTALNL